jgi:hypothetical protein
MINDDTSCSLEFDLVLRLELELEFIGMDALGGASTSLEWIRCIYWNTDRCRRRRISLSIMAKIKLDYTKYHVC